MRMGEGAWLRSQRAFAREAARLAEREGCGVMAFNTNALWTFEILKEMGLPCVIDQTIAHRRWSDRIGQAECDHHPEWGDTWAAPTYRAQWEDEELRLADLVLCGSEFCAWTMEQEGVPGEKLVVIPYGADTATFVPGPERPSTEKVKLLFVGSLSLRKGVHHLLRAAGRLGPSRVSVTAVGSSRVSGAALGKYSAILNTLPFQLHEDMPRIYQDHDLYVFPSLVEGSSLSIYEAMASAMPVITTPNSGSLVRDGVEGLIVPAGDEDALAEAIGRLGRNRDLRLEMGRAARKRAEEVGDWNHYGDRLAKVLREFAMRQAPRVVR